MKNAVAGKKILLLYARFFGYDVIVKNKLEELGAIVDLYDARANINVVEKAIKKVYPPYYYAKQRRFHRKIQENSRSKKYDYIFSNENIEISTLENYRKLFPDAKMVLYLDDSVENMRGVEKTFDSYDVVLTFDRNDACKYGVKFRPLFFSDDFTKLKNGVVENKYDICFVGTTHSDRLNIIDQIERSADLRSYMYCYLQSWFMYYYYCIKVPKYREKGKNYFKYEQLSMGKVAEVMAMSKTILDIQHPKQTGLTMRTIETLGLGKKIITTNADIKNYDFYCPENVLIIDRKNPKVDKAFWDREAKPLEKDIYEKYSLEGWIQAVFE